METSPRNGTNPALRKFDSGPRVSGCRKYSKTGASSAFTLSGLCRSLVSTASDGANAVSISGLNSVDNGLANISSLLGILNVGVHLPS